MQLYEFQAKKIFEQNGIQVPRGRLAQSAREAAMVAEETGRAVAIKAQVLVGGRGLAGGIKFADKPGQAEKVASQVLGSLLKGERPQAVLVEEMLEASQELYAGITYDFQRKCPVVIGSSRGGVDIEAVAREHPTDVTRKLIDPFMGFRPYIGRELAAKVGL